MKIAITGAAGLVARALASEYASSGAVIAALHHSALDITNRRGVLEKMSELRPDVIFNCAVIGVDECERDPAAARAINVDGPGNLAEAARRCGAAIVHFSTNYVFDGERETLYTIEDEPRPVNVYGATKAEGEFRVAQTSARAFVVRTSWVFGPGKDNFLSTAAKRLRSGQRVTAVRDVWASTTYVWDLANRVAEIVRRGEQGTYHVVNGGVCSYAEFAFEAARLTGADPSLVDLTTEAAMMRAPRPRYTPMRCLLSERLGLAPMPGWRQALARSVAAEDSSRRV